jgi:hypothetical protein
MSHTDTSQILRKGMCDILEAWAHRANGSGVDDTLYWLLRLKLAQTGLTPGVTVNDLSSRVPEDQREGVLGALRSTSAYFDDVRYASLEPVTQLWGIIVNGLRVAASSDRATEVQKDVFAYPPESLVSFFRAARERMEVADALYHVFKAMPAPECQALAALLNVHVDARFDIDVMCRLVRLLDHEGPMSEEERHVLSTLSNTKLVDATFRGLRSHA